MSFAVVTVFLLLFEIYGSANAVCSTGWQQYGDYCYTIVTASSKSSNPNFNSSLSACNNISGNLPTFNTAQDWTDFTAFASANSITGLSALGYVKYPGTGAYTSIYDGQQPPVTNWGTGQPNTSAGFTVVSYSSNNYWESDNWTINPLTIVCQQSPIYNSNITDVPCASMSRCFSFLKHHRFTTDPNNCTLGGLSLESSNIGYTSSSYIPSLTEPLYEMMNPVSKSLMMAYSSTGKNAAMASGYTTTNRVTYVFSQQYGASVPYVLLWNSAKPSDSLISPQNSPEANSLISGGWQVTGNFYMFPSQTGAGVCGIVSTTSTQTVSTTEWTGSTLSSTSTTPGSAPSSTSANICARIPLLDFSTNCTKNEFSTYIDGICYQLQSNTGTFASASDNCISQGSRLAVIRSADVAEYIYDTFRQSSWSMISFQLWIDFANSTPSSYNLLQGSTSTDGETKLYVSIANSTCTALHWNTTSPDSFTITDSSACTSSMPYFCETWPAFDRKGCGQSLARNPCIVATSVTVATVEECAGRCSLKTWCAGFNYNTNSRTCELLTGNLSNNQMVCDPEWEYYERV